MSKKEKPKPYQIGDTWYLNGRTLDCHSCKYYAKQEEIETDNDYMAGYDYCSYHRFKFKFDLSPGSDYSTCEHFLYNEDEKENIGCLPVLIGWIVLAIIWHFLTN